MAPSPPVCLSSDRTGKESQHPAPALQRGLDEVQDEPGDRPRRGPHTPVFTRRPRSPRTLTLIHLCTVIHTHTAETCMTRGMGVKTVAVLPPCGRYGAWACQVMTITPSAPHPFLLEPYKLYPSNTSCDCFPELHLRNSYTAVTCHSAGNQTRETTEAQT